jgi:alkanesulfonate monooxygenase SsuD/methylene tetrahydromethanopterin reductase-like flavin-dependent oxidoreductase (luciferase family)
VTGVHHRQAGLLAKIVTTLDVLSGGRAWLGIGAGWNEQESRGLGIPFPPLKERFEELEETIQVCLQMWSESDARFSGKHYRLERSLNSPQSLTRPHPPIMIGGSGEKKTLRLVARYADACNLFPSPQLPHKLEVLRAHCEAEGRDYGSIEKTAMFSFDVGERGEKVDRLLGQLRWLSGMGVESAIGSVKDVWKIEPLRIMGERVIPAAAELRPAA